MVKIEAGAVRPFGVTMSVSPSHEVAVPHDIRSTKDWRSTFNIFLLPGLHLHCSIPCIMTPSHCDKVLTAIVACYDCIEGR